MNLRRVICSLWSRDIRPYGRVEVQNLRFNRRFCPYMIQIETRRVSSFTRRSRISLREAEYHAPKVHITCRMAHITWVYRSAINPNLFSPRRYILAYSPAHLHIFKPTKIFPYKFPKPLDKFFTRVYNIPIKSDERKPVGRDDPHREPSVGARRRGSSG